MKPTCSRKALVFGKFLDVSTGHVMREDLAELRRSACPITSYPYTEGVWVHVSPDVTAKALPQLGFSEGFTQVYLAAQKAKCWFIRLDCDGYEYDRFPRYNW